jgi:effector-binding domain-containing protein
MRRKWLLVSALIVVAIIGAAVYFFTRGPDLSAYERFREPTILSMGDQRVIVVETVGAPEKTAGEALKLLFKLYFQLDGVTKGPHMPAPRARWPRDLNVPQDQWLGRFALPVPEGVTTLPAFGAKPGLTVKLDTWTYGEVAQILHIGPYDEEAPTVDRLHAFAKGQGCEITGEHEEEYLRGPGMFGKGNPDQYYTLIRFPVRPLAH